MAYDKVIDSAQLDAAITATADKIRAGTGSADKIKWDESKGFADAIPSSVEQAVPSISVSNGGLITASVEQGAGVVKSGTKSTTKQLSVQAATTVTPGTSEKTAVSSGKYTIGAVKVKGDANLKAANIAKGVSIFGVTGTHEGSGGAKVTTGTFTSIGGYLYNKPITVSGIAFTPTRVIFYVSNTSVIDYGDGILMADSDGRFFTAKYTTEEYDDDTEETFYYYSVGTFDGRDSHSGGGFNIVMNSDGFTITANNPGEYSQVYMDSNIRYQYIAIG